MQHLQALSAGILVASHIFVSSGWTSLAYDHEQNRELFQVVLVGYLHSQLQLEVALLVGQTSGQLVVLTPFPASSWLENSQWCHEWLKDMTSEGTEYADPSLSDCDQQTLTAAFPECG